MTFSSWPSLTATMPSTPHTAATAELLAEIAARVARLVPGVAGVSIHNARGRALWASHTFHSPIDYSLVAELTDRSNHVRNHAGHWLVSASEARSIAALPAFDDEHRFRAILLVSIAGTQWNDERQADMLGRLNRILPGLATAVRVFTASSEHISSSDTTTEAPTLAQRAATPSSGDPHWNDTRVVALIDASLAGAGFELHLQPIVALQADANSPQHLEVLLRLRAASGELLGPNTFLPVAARHQRSVAIDRWVVRVLLSWMRRHSLRWMKSRTVFSINLSSAAVADREFGRYLELCFDKCGVPLQALRFEIDERDAISTPAEFARLTKLLVGRGCEVSIDHAGHSDDGYAYLHDSTATFFKIDADLIHGATQDHVKRAVITGLVHMAGALGMKTVAERVESRAEIATVQALGVDYAQGFGLRTPEPLEGYDFELVAIAH
jgi:EAL domain-containing protein (putative c-di-GMP-specific phosphodiesterase class I)